MSTSYTKVRARYLHGLESMFMDVYYWKRIILGDDIALKRIDQLWIMVLKAYQVSCCIWCGCDEVSWLGSNAAFYQVTSSTWMTWYYDSSNSNGWMKGSTMQYEEADMIWNPFDIPVNTQCIQSSTAYHLQHCDCMIYQGAIMVEQVLIAWFCHQTHKEKHRFKKMKKYVRVSIQSLPYDGSIIYQSTTILSYLLTSPWTITFTHHPVS